MLTDTQNELWDQMAQVQIPPIHGLPEWPWANPFPSSSLYRLFIKIEGPGMSFLSAPRVLGLSTVS